jgi:glyoxylase-like metal-dependent hydrolase (beta-lactamase superfamily II)
MKRALLLGEMILLAALATTLGSATQAQDRPAMPGPPGGMKMMMGAVGTIQKVAANVYVIPGGGGNTTVFVSSKGVVLVDSKLPDQGQAVLDQVRTVTDKPVIYLINTHSHFDHTGSNGFFPESVTIVAQENCAKQLQAGPAAQTPEGKRGLARTTYTDRLRLLSGDDAVDLYNFGPAHTNGDTLVVFPHAGVMAAGDVFPGKNQPLIDTRNGGSALNFGEFIGKAAHTIQHVSVVIPGHSPPLTWQDFVDAGEFNRLMATHARESLKAGKTSEEALKSFQLPAKFSDYKLGPTMLEHSPAGNFETLYQQLKAQ